MPLELMTIKQVAAFLKSSRSHVYALIREKRVPYIKFDGSARVYFDRTRLEEFLKACEVEPCPLRGVWVEPEWLALKNRKREKTSKGPAKTPSRPWKLD